MWDHWRSAVVLVYIGSSLAVPSVPWKYIFVSKRAEQGVTWHNFSSHTGAAEGYQPISDQNREGGDVAFFGGYSDSYNLDAGGSVSTQQRLCRFSSRLNIMEADTQMPNNRRKRTKFRIIKRGRRYPGFRIVDRVYVAASSCWGHVAGLKQLYFAACAKISSTHETMYSRISLSPGICDKGDYTHHEESFFAFVENCRHPEIPANGEVELVNQTTLVGATALFSCRHGFWRTGSHNATCQADAIWHYLDETWPECTAIRCPELMDVDNGQAIGNSTAVDSQRSFRCDVGYTLEGNDTVTCEQVENQGHGRWSGDIPTCREMFCPQPTAPENGRVDGDQHSYGSVIRYSCNVRYRLRGADRSWCRMAGWDAPVPTCVAIECESLNAPENGHLSDSCGTSLNTQCEVTCDPGYVLTSGDSRHRRCTAKGWTGPTPNCTACPKNTYKRHPAADVCTQCPTNTVTVAGRAATSSLACRCALGFSGNPGGPCTDVNECRVSNGGCNQICENTLGSFYCGCNIPGYVLRDDGRACIKNISCADPGMAAHARRVGWSNAVGATVTYTCERGYRLSGDASITCDDNGRWSNQGPQCQPVTCPPMGTIRYGSRDSDSRTYGSTVRFSCLPGYQVAGQAETTCQADSTWSSPTPKCAACPEGSYKERRADQDCTLCPEHSTTVTTGNANRRHCVCVDGAVGPPGGPCIMVKCESLSAPENGHLSANCGRNLYSQCEVTCDPGFVQIGGSRSRRCTAQGWTGSTPSCTACPRNTYKLHPAADVCTQCPINTVTAAGQPATSIRACRCAPGFTGNPGGPCADVNECRINNGGCNQTCENTFGAFNCRCHIAGYVLRDDGRACVRNQSCPPLSQRPRHGSVQCRYSQRNYGHICFIRCDRGYFFVSGANNYVTCGPGSDFQWSHRQLNKTARIPACTREFFVDVNLPLGLTYKSRNDCNESSMETSALTERLEGAVNTISVCSNTCQVTVINVTCREDSGDMVAAFDVLQHNPQPREVPFNCTLACKRNNMRAMLRDTFRLKQGVEALVTSQPHSFQLPVQGAPTVAPRSFLFGTPRMLCESGRVLTKHRLCVPCDKGFYLPNRDLKTCLPCPKGTYQNEHGQTDCKPCLEGSTTVAEGADNPTMCSVRVDIVTDRV